MAVPSLSALPHRPPFCFLTSVLEMEPGIAGSARWTLTGDENFFKGHFPGDPLVPGVLLAESLAQLSGMVAYAEDEISGGPPPQLAQVNIKFLNAVRPPASIDLTARLTRRMAGLCLFDVTATAQEAIAAKGTLVLAHQKSDSMEDPT